MKLIHSPDADPEFQLLCELHTSAHKAALDAMRNWSSVTDLVDFAVCRHGYQNTDGFFGITYPNDLDDFDRENGYSIPDNYVEANAWYGDPEGESFLLLESEYLELLRQFLVLKGYNDLADRIQALFRNDA